MPKKKVKKIYCKQMKIARVAIPRDRIAAANFRVLRRGRKKTMAKLCARGKAVVNVSLVFPSAYANMYVMYVVVE